MSSFLQLKDSASALATAKDEALQLAEANAAIKSELQSLQQLEGAEEKPTLLEPSSQSHELEAELALLKQKLLSAHETLQSRDAALRASSEEVKKLSGAAADLQSSRDFLQVDLHKLLIGYCKSFYAARTAPDCLQRKCR